MVNDIDPGSVHPTMAALNWIYSKEGDEFQPAVQALIEAATPREVKQAAANNMGKVNTHFNLTDLNQQTCTRILNGFNIGVLLKFCAITFYNLYCPGEAMHQRHLPGGTLSTCRCCLEFPWRFSWPTNPCVIEASWA